MSNTKESPLLKLELAQISNLKKFLLLSILLLCFSPLLLSTSWSGKIDDYLGYWVVIWLLLFFVVIGFIPKTNKSGNIVFYTDQVYLKLKEKTIIIPIVDIQKMEVKYNGYKGEDVQYSFPFFYSFNSKYGLCDITIFLTNKTLFYTYVAKKSTLKELNILKGTYSNSVEVVIF